MVSYEELREDVVYLTFVEFAVLVSLSANAIFSNCSLCVFHYILAYLWLVLLQLKILKRYRITMERDIKVKFDILDREKSNAKRSLAAVVFLSVLLSSWGVVGFLTSDYHVGMSYILSLSMALPAFAVLYFVWLLYLSHLKRKYIIFLKSILKKKNRVNQ